MWWTKDIQRRHYWELDCPMNVSPQVNMRSLSESDWQATRILETLESHDLVAVAKDHNEEIEAINTEPAQVSDHSQLSPIPEGTEPSEDQVSLYVSKEDRILLHEDPELERALQEATIVQECLSEVCLHTKFDTQCRALDQASWEEPSGPTYEPVDAQRYYNVISANVEAGLPAEYKLEEDLDYSEVYFEGDTWKLLSDVPRPPQKGEVVCLRIYPSNVKRAVIVISAQSSSRMTTS